MARDGERDGGFTTFPTVRVIFAGVLGWPCGWQATQSRPRLVSGLQPHTYLGGGAGNVAHSELGEIDKVRGIPEGPRYRSGVATSYERLVVAWR